MTQEEMFKKLPVLVYDEIEGYRKANVADCSDDMVYPSINYDKSSKQFIVSYFNEPEDDEDGHVVYEYFVGETMGEAIRNAYNNFVKGGLIKIKEKKTICSKCAFSVDNSYCGLPGFTSEYPRYKDEGLLTVDE